VRNDGAGSLASVNLLIRSSSRNRHKSDSIQLAVSLQRDRKENAAESFHCDRIAPHHRSTRAMRRRPRMEKILARALSVNDSGRKISCGKLAPKKMRRQKLRRKNLAPKFRGKICPQKIRAENCVRNPDTKTAAPR
jgi:hypothetical protein